MKKLEILTVVLLFVMPACAGGAARPDIDPVTEVVVTTVTAPVVATPPTIPDPTTVTAQPVHSSSSAVLAAGPPATPSPFPTPTALPTSTLTPTPDIDWATVTGRTTEGLNYLGNPRAPVTMIDFSDFM